MMLKNCGKSKLFHVNKIGQQNCGKNKLFHVDKIATKAYFFDEFHIFLSAKWLKILQSTKLKLQLHGYMYDEIQSSKCIYFSTISCSTFHKGGQPSSKHS